MQYHLKRNGNIYIKSTKMDTQQVDMKKYCLKSNWAIEEIVTPRIL